MEKKLTRHSAQKMMIMGIPRGDYVFKEGSSSQVYSPDGGALLRINLVALIVRRETVGSMTNVIIEDGTGTIVARFFEETPFLSLIEPGKTVRVIGKVRKYNNEWYIAPEIAKVVDFLWIKVHALECSQGDVKKVPEEDVVGAATRMVDETSSFPARKVADWVQKLDQGQGALVEEVIERVNFENAEEVVEKMIKEGNLFQIMPGRVKLL